MFESVTQPTGVLLPLFSQQQSIPRQCSILHRHVLLPEDVYFKSKVFQHSGTNNGWNAATRGYIRTAMAFLRFFCWKLILDGFAETKLLAQQESRRSHNFLWTPSLGIFSRRPP